MIEQLAGELSALRATLDERRPIAVGDLVGNGTLVVCSDGAVFASFPDGDKHRVWTEGTPIPGTRRAQEFTP